MPCRRINSKAWPALFGLTEEGGDEEVGLARGVGGCEGTRSVGDQEGAVRGEAQPAGGGVGGVVAGREGGDEVGGQGQGGGRGQVRGEGLSSEGREGRARGGEGEGLPHQRPLHAVQTAVESPPERPGSCRERGEEDRLQGRLGGPAPRCDARPRQRGPHDQHGAGDVGQARHEALGEGGELGRRGRCPALEGQLGCPGIGVGIGGGAPGTRGHGQAQGSSHDGVHGARVGEEGGGLEGGCRLEEQRCGLVPRHCGWPGVVAPVVCRDQCQCVTLGVLDYSEGVSRRRHFLQRRGGTLGLGGRGQRGVLRRDGHGGGVMGEGQRAEWLGEVEAQGTTRQRDGGHLVDCVVVRNVLVGERRLAPDAQGAHGSKGGGGGAVDAIGGRPEDQRCTARRGS